MSESIFCPYCRNSRATSDDHIFSDFLGGSETILACARCNNRFGHDFEGRISKQLAPLFFMLEGCGLFFRKPITWKKGFTHKTTGLSYDLERDKKTNKVLARLSGTTLIESEPGTQSLRMPDLKTARRKFKELQAHSKRGFRFGVNREKAEISRYGLFILIDNDFRRLILKMCVAFSRKMNKDQAIIDDSALLYLSDSEKHHHVVNFDFNHYSLLDAAVPALAHSIYIEACPQHGQAYALVRLFGTFQFFTILHNNYQGLQFAGIGVLNPIDFSEKFQLIEPILHLAEIPQYVLPFLAGYHTRNMYRRLDSKILQTFGKNEYTFAPDEVSMILSQIRISTGLS
ncbi:MAG: HNH endonuclease [Nitrosomonas sp.]|nr:MAG: HNH endonuclease [Nitrosomonas sp.]